MPPACFLYAPTVHKEMIILSTKPHNHHGCGVSFYTNSKINVLFYLAVYAPCHPELSQFKACHIKSPPKINSMRYHKNALLLCRCSHYQHKIKSLFPPKPKIHTNIPEINPQNNSQNRTSDVYQFSHKSTNLFFHKVQQLVLVQKSYFTKSNTY